MQEFHLNSVFLTAGPYVDKKTQVILKDLNIR